MPRSCFHSSGQKRTAGTFGASCLASVVLPEPGRPQMRINRASVMSTQLSQTLINLQITDCSSSSAGLSLRQGWHHVALKLITTVGPRRSLSLISLPSSVSRTKLGASFPSSVPTVRLSDGRPIKLCASHCWGTKVPPSLRSDWADRMKSEALCRRLGPSRLSRIEVRREPHHYQSDGSAESGQDKWQTRAETVRGIAGGIRAIE